MDAALDLNPDLDSPTNSPAAVLAVLVAGRKRLFGDADIPLPAAAIVDLQLLIRPTDPRQDGRTRMLASQFDHLTAKLDAAMLEVQRLYVRLFVEPNEDVLSDILLHLHQVVNAVWWLLPPRYAFEGQDQYLMLVAGLLPDYLAKLGVTPRNVLLLLRFLDDLDDKLAFLATGYTFLSEASPGAEQRAVMDVTLQIRLEALASTVRVSVTEEAAKAEIEGYQQELGEVFARVLDATSEPLG